MPSIKNRDSQYQNQVGWSIGVNFVSIRDGGVFTGCIKRAYGKNTHVVEFSISGR
jgi:hypothetical protein